MITHLHSTTHQAVRTIPAHLGNVESWKIQRGDTVLGYASRKAGTPEFVLNTATGLDPLSAPSTLEEAIEILLAVDQATR